MQLTRAAEVSEARRRTHKVSTGRADALAASHFHVDPFSEPKTDPRPDAVGSPGGWVGCMRNRPSDTLKIPWPVQRKLTFILVRRRATLVASIYLGRILFPFAPNLLWALKVRAISPQLLRPHHPPTTTTLHHVLQRPEPTPVINRYAQSAHQTSFPAPAS